MGFDESWDRALRGDFSSLLEERSASLAGPKRLAIDALVALIAGRPPSVSDAAAARSAMALQYVSLRAVLDDDPRTLEASVDALRSFAPDSIDAVIARRWQGLVRRTNAPPAVARNPGERMILGVQDALAALEIGDIEAATKKARHMSRMARTDGYVLHEYVASLALARVRRYGERPHLAIRILQSLARVLPGPWRGWLGWERALAGLPVDAQQPGWSATTALMETFEAAAAGDRRRFELLVAETPRSALWAREHAVVVAAVDLTRQPPVAAHAFLREGVGPRPGAVGGLAVSTVDVGGRERPAVFIVTGPSGSRRVLAAGLELAEIDPRHRLDESFTLAQGRPYRLLAELAFAPDGSLDTAVSFERVYGFSYQPARHGGVFRSLLNRTRAALPESATLERRDDRIVLRASEAIAFPDPRCAPELEALLLQSLAERGGRASARELAEAVGVSVRTVQTSLKGLIEDGACESEGRGRASTYRLEDTTFMEPTLDRMRPHGVPSDDTSRGR